ncbi:Hypothetical predicted protein, partial [Marmota monax]
IAMPAPLREGPYFSAILLKLKNISGPIERTPAYCRGSSFVLCLRETAHLLLDSQGLKDIRSATACVSKVMRFIACHFLL